VKELLEYLAKALVDHPNEVNVSLVEGEKSQILELRVNHADMGKVIGKQGRIAQALRIIVKAAAVKEGKKVMVEIIE
jgi:predicted RNA-binding protein YlqC (UPF0109 family)